VVGGVRRRIRATREQIENGKIVRKKVKDQESIQKQKKRGTNKFIGLVEKKTRGNKPLP